MGKKNKPKSKNKNNTSTTNSSNSNVKLEDVIVKSDSESIILTQSQQDDVDSYISKLKNDADDYLKKMQDDGDNYYKKMKDDADNYFKVKEKEANDLEKNFELRVENEVKKRTQNLKTREDRLTSDLEKYNKEFAKLEQEKENYKNEQLEIVREKLNDIIKEKEQMEDEKNKLLVQNKRLTAENEVLKENDSDYREQLKISAQKDGKNSALQTEIDTLNSALEETKNMYKEASIKVRELSSVLLKCGDNPEELININSNLEKENKILKDSLVNKPSDLELKILRETKKQYDIYFEKYSKLLLEVEDLKHKNEILDLTNSKLETTKKTLEIIKAEKESLEAELDKTLNLYKQNVESVFATLSKIDEQSFTSYDDINITLKDLCDHFRGYLQNRKENPLYYDKQTIRSFIAGLASSRTMILEGLSGTGKTRLPLSFSDFAHVKVKVISVQSSWKDRNDLLGYYNDFKKQYKETEFLKAVYQACCDLNNIYLIVLDEMNLSRIEYYFADFLSVLEKDENEWQIDLISDYASISNNGKFPKKIHEGKLRIYNNIWFIGTANKDDSTFMISDKVYDRSTVIYFDEKGKKELLLRSFSEINLNKTTLLKLFSQASEFEKPEDAKKFQEIINDLDKKIKDLFGITFGNRIENQLKKFVPAYIKCGGTLIEAIDVVFARKILRKLEGIYDENTKENLEKLEDYIISKYEMLKSLDTIERLTKTM